MAKIMVPNNAYTAFINPNGRVMSAIKTANGTVPIKIAI